MPSCIFNSPRKIAGKLYPKSKKAVQLDDKVLKDWFFQACVKAGDISVLAAQKAAKADKAPAK